MNRKTLDVAIPMIFGIVEAATAVTAAGAMAVVAIIGGGIVGIYFAALRQNLPDE